MKRLALAAALTWAVAAAVAVVRAVLEANSADPWPEVTWRWNAR